MKQQFSGERRRQNSCKKTKILITRCTKTEHIHHAPQGQNSAPFIKNLQAAFEGIDENCIYVSRAAEEKTFNLLAKGNSVMFYLDLAEAS